MRTVPGLDIPNDFYWIFDGEAPLAGMRYPPESTPWERLRILGFKYVINLETTQPRYNPRPLHVLASVQMQDLWSGGDPTESETEAALIHRVVNTIRKNRLPDAGVIVHCVGGRGRTGTVIGCYLRSTGMPADQVVADLNSLHKVRGKQGWPESPWQEQFVRNYSSNMGAR